MKIELLGLEEIPEAERAAVMKHVAMAKEMRQIYAWGDRLVDHMNSKRFIEKKGRMVPRTPQYRMLKPYYDKILFAGRGCRRVFDPFPGYFQSSLEMTMLTEAPSIKGMDCSRCGPGFRWARVYYGHKWRGRTVSTEGWKLKMIVDDDISMMRRYRDAVLDYMQRAINIVELVRGPWHPGLIKMQFEMMRYRRLTEDL